MYVCMYVCMYVICGGPALPSKAWSPLFSHCSSITLNNFVMVILDMYRVNTVHIPALCSASWRDPLR